MKSIPACLRHGTRIATGVLTFLLISGCETEPTPKGCLIETRGKMALLNITGSPTARVGINGHTVAMIVDSGAALSLVGEAQAPGLGLDGRFTRALLRGVGGDAFLQVAEISELDLGTAASKDQYIGVGGRFSGSVQGVPVVGLFGGDYLSNYELIVDMPERDVELVRTYSCPGPTPGWAGPIHSFAFRNFDGDGTKIELTTQINGNDANTYLDTGATRSLVSLSFAHDAGVTQNILEKDRRATIAGIAGNPQTIYIHRFRTLQIGDMVLRNVEMGVSDALDDVDFLLGADFLRHHRIWIKWKDRRGYFQYDKDIPGFSRTGNAMP